VSDQYHLDLKTFSLQKFKRSLESGVLPSRKILQEKLDERFAVLESLGINHLQALIDALKTKKRLADLAQQSGLPQEYLTILRREANSYLPKPVNLRDIPDTDPTHVEKLAAVGIKHSQHLFVRAKSKRARAELSQQTGVPEEALVELLKLSDLARINGAGPVFVRLFYAAGVETLEELARCSPEPLLERLRAVNAAKQYTRAMASLKDIQYCIQTAQELPQVIE